MITQSRPSHPRATVANSNSAAVVRIHSDRAPGAAPFEVNYNNKPLVDFLHLRTPSTTSQWLNRWFKGDNDNAFELPQPPSLGEIVRWRLKHPNRTPSSKVDNLIEFHASNSPHSIVSRAELLALHREREQSSQLIQRLMRHRAIAALIASLALGLTIGVAISHYQTNQLLTLPQSILHSPPAPQTLANKTTSATLAITQIERPTQKSVIPALDAHVADDIPIAAPIATPIAAVKKTVATEIPQQVQPVPAWQNQLQAWSAAWAAGDIPRYIASYTSNYQPHRVLSAGSKPNHQPNHQPSHKPSHKPNHKQWVNQRTQKLQSSKHIEVKLSDVRWQIPTDLAQPIQVRFIQDYRSSNYRDRVEKVISMRRNDAGKWLISAERTIRALPLQ